MAVVRALIAAFRLAHSIINPAFLSHDSTLALDLMHRSGPELFHHSASARLRNGVPIFLQEVAIDIF
jgi:hypothetical protein